jgi:hypothetical protein
MRLETHMPNFAYTSERRSGLGLRAETRIARLRTARYRAIRSQLADVLSKDIKN